MSEIAELRLTFDAAINYAFQQNAIPVVQELWLRNGDVPRQNVVVRLTTEPEFAAPAEFRFQSLAAGEELRVAPVDLKVGHDFLAELPERLSGWLRVEIAEGEVTIHSQSEPIALLARNEWCGLVSLPEILAAFVLPNDPAVMHVLGKAAELLCANTGRTGFNGYQDKSRKRAWEQAAAIYRAIAELGIRYISPPASFETTGQKVRFPSDIVGQRFATCLDLALLFAACCEQAGLHPLICIHEAHAYGGLWLEEQTLPDSATDDLQHIRKLKDSGLLSVFETTAVADQSPGTLDHAEILANPHLVTKKPFRLALDVRAARLARIRPLPIPGGEFTGARTDANTLDTQEGLGGREIPEPILLIPDAAKAATRIDQWKSRLLDLSLRNRLLNFKETKSTIRVLSDAPERVEDELAAERELVFLPRPRLLAESDPRNAQTMTKQQQADALAEHLRDELRHKRLHSPLDEQEHSRRLTEIFRSARTSMEENGTNTLFAAVGLLEWRETQHSERILRAPILLVPIEVKRKSVLEGFSVRRIDEETRLNVTLMEMLRQHFRKEISGLDPLPEDDQGVDVRRVFQVFRDAVRNLPGWEVKSEIWIGQFSFTKFLLWKDLTDRLDDLAKNRIVKHLIEEGGAQYPNPTDDIRPAGLDDRFHPRDVFCPRSADSSQLAAVMAAAAGHDFVLEGPPGTGKSQTITNIIAHCLAHGKRVLFVAEKRAALDVVHRRLREDGLEPFCLELHSNKTGKTEVLAQFDRALKFAARGTPVDWEHRARELGDLRNSLNLYVAALHKPYACGLSPYQCLDYLLPRTEELTVKLVGWNAILETSRDKLARAREVAGLLQDRAHPLTPLAGHPLSIVEVEEWSPAWAEDTLEVISDVQRLAVKASGSTRDLLDAFKWDRPHASLAELTRLAGLVESLVAPESVGPAFTTTTWKQLAGDIDHWTTLSQERTQLRKECGLIHSTKDDVLRTLDCEGWTPERLSGTLNRCRKLQEELFEARRAIREMRGWLRAPTEVARKEELEPLGALAEILLSAHPLGSEFATTGWAEWSTEFDRWIERVKERQELRGRLAGFLEPALLRLDLNGLTTKWGSARTAWFLLKMLRVASVRRALRSARLDGTATADEAIDGILTAAIRLRTVSEEIANANQSASKLLGACWRDGEPDTDELTRVRSWTTEFDERLNAVCKSDSAWNSRARAVLAEFIRAGSAELAPNSATRVRLEGWLERIRKVTADCDRTLDDARLVREHLDESTDFCSTVGDALSLLGRCAPRIAKINAEIAASASSARLCLGELWRGGEPLYNELLRVKTWGELLNSRMATFAADNLNWLGEFRRLLGGIFAEGGSALEEGAPLYTKMLNFVESRQNLASSLGELKPRALLNTRTIDASADFAGAVGTCTDELRRSWGKVREWCSWLKARREASDLGLLPLVAALESGSDSIGDLPALFERSFRRALLFASIQSRAPLLNFFGGEHGTKIEKFRELDERMQKLARELVAARLAAEIPGDQIREDIPKAETALLRKELGKKMRHIPVRKLIGSIPTLLTRLKPCLLMSPLSVAQYLDAAHTAFDVVVFDEASQIPVWDAVGAIARGNQLIVVGDPKQLPPTNFFNSQEEDDEDLVPPEFKDLESILDELLTNGLRHKRLQWHYRSRHEGLISFSNRQYYENELLTFPSPEKEAGGVRFRYLPDARYDKGKSRTNRKEAEALVEELVSRLRLADGARRSYGVVTFSQAQQSLVENLLDEERRKYPEIEVHFGEEPPVEGEPVFVKNLENVQGDERDVILFSICYGPDGNGKVSMNFGPINRVGGERRLNVAVTRAKHEVLVFSGLKADQIDLTRTRSRGVRDLKLFLEYAERGPRVLATQSVASADAEPESEFERLVAERLMAAGYIVHYQVGCSAYRIDLAIVDPTSPGRYLLGIECDGATYHRAATARDRDKLRQAILEGLGWKLYRIWSTDWWHKPDAEMSKLCAVIDELQEAARASRMGIVRTDT